MWIWRDIQKYANIWLPWSYPSKISAYALYLLSWTIEHNGWMLMTRAVVQAFARHPVSPSLHWSPAWWYNTSAWCVWLPRWRWQLLSASLQWPFPMLTSWAMMNVMLEKMRLVYQPLAHSRRSGCKPSGCLLQGPKKISAKDSDGC